MAVARGAGREAWSGAVVGGVAAEHVAVVRARGMAAAVRSQLSTYRQGQQNDGRSPHSGATAGLWSKAIDVGSCSSRDSGSIGQPQGKRSIGPSGGEGGVSQPLQAWVKKGTVSTSRQNLHNQRDALMYTGGKHYWWFDVSTKTKPTLFSLNQDS